LWGFHTALEALDRLADSSIGAVFSFYGGQPEPDYEAEILRCVAERKNLVVVRDIAPTAFVRMLAIADGYLRTTSADGDASAIREALYVGTPVIASDCVLRPAPCSLFPTGDAGQLAARIRRLIAEGQQRTSAGQSAADFGAPVLALYRELARELLASC
jgi:glycosyltransferase involved in cell wall biosynthesis